jgi:hypothetical protein
MKAITVKSNWSQAVRRAAIRCRTALGTSDRILQLRLELGRDEEESLLLKAAEEALALAELLQDLGYGSREKERYGVDAVDLELEVHNGHKDASRNLFRCIIAERQGSSLRAILSKRGRLDTAEEAEEMRTEHVARLRAALEVEEEKEEGFLSPDYAPWVRQVRDGRTVPSVRRPRFQDGSLLETLEDQLSDLVDREAA